MALARLFTNKGDNAAMPKLDELLASLLAHVALFTITQFQGFF